MPRKVKRGSSCSGSITRRRGLGRKSVQVASRRKSCGCGSSSRKRRQSRKRMRGSGYGSGSGSGLGGSPILPNKV